ncbi:MAG: fructosamine kinase family protein [Magnetovibrio sp.]|nr:fructosamine kinase family protein [Magnetovibrio sp.]
MSTVLNSQITALVGANVDQIIPLSGGCVGDVFQAELSDGRTIVVKTADPGTPAAQGLSIEAKMLQYQRNNSTLPVPDVLAVDDGMLLMSRLENGGGLGTTVQEDAASIVAQMHSITTDQGYGFEFDTVIGGLHQPNPWTKRWLVFFRDQRLMYMGRNAERMGRLPTSVLNRLNSFCDHLDRWIFEPNQPALIHGDMWSGNVLSAHGRITGFIDPAIYYAHPEIELAFTTMFSTFGKPFFQAYQSIHPIEPGFFEERLYIYNLYPLLVHVRLFGGSYVSSIDTTLKRFGF